MFGTIHWGFCRKAPKGLTLTEVLVTITIVSMLMAMGFGVLALSRRDARITQCKNNLAQIYKAIQMFDDDHDRFAENYPGRITFLNYFKGTRQREYMLAPSVDNSSEVYEGTRYLPADSIFICPLDDSFGREGGKPKYAKDQFPETDEGPSRGTPQLFDKSPWSSYLYEFSEAECDWWDGWVEGPDEFPPYGPYEIAQGGRETDAIPGDQDSEIIDTNWDYKVTWQETKFYQQKYGDSWLHGGNWKGGYPRTYFPVVRCFWHQRNADTDAFHPEIMNLTMTGSFFTSKPKWEEVAAGEIDPDATRDDSGDDNWDDEG